MESKNWPQWLTDKNLGAYNNASVVGFLDQKFTVILETFYDPSDRSKFKLVWNQVYSYMETYDSFIEDAWLPEEERAWPFYKLTSSPYIAAFKAENTLKQEQEIYHFIIASDKLIHILAEQEPQIYLFEDHNQPLHEFSELSGFAVEAIPGQSRFAYALSDLTDFFDIPELISHNGFYQGSIIKFYDQLTAQVYTPFELEQNVAYSRPLYLDTAYYFLQADFNTELVRIYLFLPGETPLQIEEFQMKDLNLYNLELMGRELHLVSSDDNLEIYYPFRETVILEANESALFITEDSVYISAWVEEGWDEENNIASPNYRLYNKLVVKDFKSQLILEKTGDLYQDSSGYWRLA